MPERLKADEGYDRLIEKWFDVEFANKGRTATTTKTAMDALSSGDFSKLLAPKSRPIDELVYKEMAAPVIERYQRASPDQSFLEVIQ